MTPGICNEELQSCEDAKLSDSQLWRKLLRKTGNCFSLAVNAVITGSFTASSTQRTLTRETISLSSTVAAGARFISFETSSDFAGTILGVAAQPDRVYVFEVKQNDDILGPIVYTITDGSAVLGKMI